MFGLEPEVKWKRRVDELVAGMAVSTRHYSSVQDIPLVMLARQDIVLTGVSVWNEDASK